MPALRRGFLRPVFSGSHDTPAATGGNGRDLGHVGGGAFHTPNPNAAAQAFAVCPGVFVLQDGSARGPGLEEALAIAADVLTLVAWADADHNRAVAIDVQGTAALAALVTDDEHKHMAPSLALALRSAADAIRNGRVPA